MCVHRQLKQNLCNDHCDNVEPEKITCLNEYNLNLTMLQLNIRGLCSNKYELFQLLKRQKTEIAIVILSKTLLMAIKRECLVVKGYNMVLNER